MATKDLWLFMNTISTINIEKCTECAYMLRKEKIALYGVSLSLPMSKCQLYHTLKQKLPQ